VGYDAEGLTNLLTANDAWAHMVLKQVARRVGDITQMRALGFCVSVDHARFMARVFNAAGVPSVAIWADTPEDQRRDALRALAERRVRVVFSVDLFNEGVDVPSVDTLLMLRPTDSPTLFLQQLGRGLRKAPHKGVCTVLDFVGHHRKEFRLDRKLTALLRCSRAALERQVHSGFPHLPAGCHFELDRVASEIVLRSIREGVPTQWSRKVEELRQLASDGRDVTLETYLAETGLELEDVFDDKSGRTWGSLREDAGLVDRPDDAEGPRTTLRKAIGRAVYGKAAIVGKEAILRNGEGVGFCPDGKGEVCEHAGFQSVIGVRNEGANGNSPRGDIDLGLDEVNLSRKLFLGISSNPQGESLPRMNGCAATFGDGEGELHSIHGIDAHEGGLRIDVLANTDVAVTENSVERGGEGVFPHPLFCQVESVRERYQAASVMKNARIFFKLFTK
jgi:hypothetical protein